MKAQFVFEKFTEKSDPIHDMGIGDPLMIAAGKMQEYAEKNGYEFEMKKIGKTESPVIYVPLKKPRIEQTSGFRGDRGASYITKRMYTITYMPHKKPNIYSLRKVYIGYAYVPTDEDYDRIRRDTGKMNHEDWQNWAIELLKREMKKGTLKQIQVKQTLMGRFSHIPTMIKRLEYSVNHEIKK